MNHLAKLNFNALLKYYLFVSFGLLTFSSCSVVNTLERGNGKNSPSFAVTSTKRIHGNQKTGLEAHSKRVEIQTRPDSKELYSSSQNKSQTQKISEGAFKQNEESVSKEIDRIEELPQIHVNSQTATPKTLNPKGASVTSFNGKSISRGMNARTNQIQKLIPIKSNLSNTNAVGFLKSFPPNGRSNSVFGPQVEFSEMDTQEILRTIGWLFIIGGPLLMLLSFEYFDSLDLFIYGVLFFVLIGLFYFWAANLSENLDDHCVAYRIGFWLTVITWPLGLTLILSIPLWIIGAIYDADN